MLSVADARERLRLSNVSGPALRRVKTAPGGARLRRGVTESLWDEEPFVDAELSAKVKAYVPPGAKTIVSAKKAPLRTMGHPMGRGRHVPTQTQAAREQKKADLAVHEEVPPVLLEKVFRALAPQRMERKKAAPRRPS